jgi:hypothetical protein
MFLIILTKNVAKMFFIKQFNKKMFCNVFNYFNKNVAKMFFANVFNCFNKKHCENIFIERFKKKNILQHFF